MDAYEIIQCIGDAKKRTPVKVTLKGQLREVTLPKTIKVFNSCKIGASLGDWADVRPFSEVNEEKTEDYVVENNVRGLVIPFLDLKDINARVEPDALIREKVEVDDQTVIMMEVILNIGVVVGAGTMIDIGAVSGGRVTVGRHYHIGAGTVLADVIESSNAVPMAIENEVVIGVNVVVPEGVRVGEGVAVTVETVVMENIPAHTVVTGVPVKVIRQVDDKTKSKTEISEELRKL